MAWVEVHLDSLQPGEKEPTASFRKKDLVLLNDAGDAALTEAALPPPPAPAPPPRPVEDDDVISDDELPPHLAQVIGKKVAIPMQQGGGYGVVARIQDGICEVTVQGRDKEEFVTSHIDELILADGTKLGRFIRKGEPDVPPTQPPAPPPPAPEPANDEEAVELPDPPLPLEVGCAVVDLNQNNRKGRIVDKSKAWYKVQFPGDASVKSLQKKSLRAIPESQAAAPRTPAPPPAPAPAPDYEFDEAAAVAAPAPAPAPAPRLASPAAFLPDVPSWPTGDAAAPAAPPPGVAAAPPPPPPAGGPKKPASKPRGRVPAAPAAPAGVILPLAAIAPPAGAPIRVRTAGGREAWCLGEDAARLV